MPRAFDMSVGITPEDREEIRKSRCINCKRNMRSYDAITFVRLGNGELIWWHNGRNCL